MTKKNGFSLIELTFLISFLSMITIGYFATTSNININDNEKLQITRDRIAMIEKAIIIFLNQNDRIPCPADPAGQIYSNLSDQSFPIEPQLINGGPDPAYSTSCNITGCINNKATTDNPNNYAWGGSVPTKTLSLPPEYGVDGWGMKINYYADTNMCQSAQSYLANEGSLTMNLVYTNDLLSNINNAAYALITLGGNGSYMTQATPNYQLNGSGGVNQYQSMNPNSNILGQGYFVYHKTKSQLNANAVDVGLKLLSQQDCSDNSLALSSLYYKASMSNPDNTLANANYLRQNIKVTERLDANIVSYCSTQPSSGGSYHCGDEAIIGIMWAVQDACALMYNITKVCPGGGTYDSTNDYCTCANKSWAGQGKC